MSEAQSYPWQEKHREICLRHIQNDTMPHAILLYGESGLGISEFGTWLAQTLLCQDSERKPCGECKTCRLWQSGQHPDYQLLEPPEDGKDIKVDTIRSAIEFLQITSHYQRKVLLIRDADMMNKAAANCLLKTLEEPPPDSVLILTSQWISKLLPTIRSRCQTLRFTCPSADLAVRWLSAETQLDENKIRKRLGTGLIRPLQALAEMQSGDEEEVAAKPEFQKDLQRLENGNEPIVPIAAKWAKQPQQFIHRWLLEISAEAIREQVANPSGNQLPIDKLFAFYDRQVKRYQLRLSNLNPQLVLEGALLEWQIIHRTRRSPKRM